jgi:hypothetical protein
MAKIDDHLPRKVSRRILERAARGEKTVVVVMRNGKPNSVWGFNEYIARQKLTKQVEPWKHKKPKVETPDPLGAIEGTPIRPVTRAEIYEE